MGLCIGILMSLDSPFSKDLTIHKVLSFNNPTPFIYFCHKNFVFSKEKIIFALVFWNVNDIYGKNGIVLWNVNDL